MRKDASLDKLFKAAISVGMSSVNRERRTPNGELQTVNCAKLLWWKSILVQR
jgi:hypothetical protein